MKGKKNTKKMVSKSPVKDTLTNLRNIATASRGISGVKNNQFIYRYY